MKPDLAPHQQPGAVKLPPADAGGLKAASSTVGSPKRPGTAVEGSKRKQRDASEKMTKTASFCLSAEQSHIAAEERDKKGVSAAKSIVVTLLSLNQFAFAARPRAMRVESFEVIRKRIQVKEKPPSPIPLQTTLGVCLTVFLHAVPGRLLGHRNV
ncbi:uncharacterized protein LOC144102224 [Amblyomma americanum]